ncbi:RagB/SusD family nutrient uptake outer membrane protein [Gramella sp. AN32]|uniref:RagB/SusD family nutrient uptake outer membrane protein n=1 Tax=Christiangramia antarctica TaxID=2058158 RepID=A0ABW5X882_9FLAO|nr:RagB/SusD family nutrient uptake outer membrane protein [Gramella sp. AN32]MCM4158115.1 RagB/SusD family nutrient uptake outer membrane protein [Gramella sp. AN32]
MNTKNVYRKLKTIPLLVIMFFFVTSCEDYLEEQPSTLIDSNYIYTTEEGLKSGVVSLYKFNRDRYDRRIEDFMGGVLIPSRSDLAFNRSGYLGLIGRYQRFVSPVDQGANFGSALFWKHFYNIANRATDIINAAETIQDINEDVRNKVIAEAKFFRANSYFYLYRMYNNIYVTTESVTVDNAFDVINNPSSQEEIFALLNSDLQFAIDNLEWNDQFGRVTKGTAKHVKAKVAMWQGNWEEAKSQAISLIEEGPHSLMPTTAEVFAGDRNNAEQLFVVQSQDDLLGGGDFTMLNANYITQYFQIPGIEANVEQGGRGFSRILPNRYLLNLIAEDSMDTRDDNTYFRLEYFYTSGDSIGKKINIYKPISDENPEGVEVERYYQRLHPSNLKFAQKDDNPDSYLQRSNIMVYRLAETYLIAAEAIMRSSGDPLPYINAIRTRAGAAELTSVDEQAILDERARELAFEGQRWFTLKRMGQDVINRQITNYAGDGEFFPNNFGAERDPRENWRPHYINFPIAQIDLDLLGPSYPQNPGY